MSKPLNYPFLFLLVGTVLSSLPLQATSQLTAGQPQSSPSAQHKPVSLPHLYWHFLLYVNTLDTHAAELESEGKDGSWLRNDLQARAKFTDAEFSPVREASTRLAAEIKTLNDKVKASGGSGPSLDGRKAMILQRENAIDAEIAFLTQSLTPENKASLDKFITEFFAPKQVSAKFSAPVHPAPPAVQQ